VIPTTLNIAFFSLFLAVAPSAQESKTARPNGPAANQPSTKPMYSVYAAACSRSFCKVGTFDNLKEARRVAQEHRKDKRAWIATGSEAGAWFLVTQVREQLNLEGCSVYVSRCRAGIQLHSKTDTLKQAEALAEQLKRDGMDVEIVYHLK
jgi:hypothetical protein